MRPPEKYPRLLLWVVALAILGARPVTACQICFPFPKNSAADFLIEAGLRVFSSRTELVLPDLLVATTRNEVGHESHVFRQLH